MRSMKVGGDSVTISGKQRAANRGGLCKLLLKNQSLSWFRGQDSNLCLSGLPLSPGPTRRINPKPPLPPAPQFVPQTELRRKATDTQIC